MTTSKHFDDATMACALEEIAQQLDFVAHFPSSDGNAREALEIARNMLAKHIRELKSQAMELIR